ncbi:MAG: hypothetical protein IJK72_01455, partial [Mycoplasma sp.]|nr:hypothetical protein [Mycoplasma sp.]
MAIKLELICLLIICDSESYANKWLGKERGNYFLISKFDKKWNFGNILNKLKVLDNKTGNENLISNDDYNFLKQMKDKRNFWCHKCFIEFIYSKNWMYSNKYLKISKKLKSDYERFSKISK